MSELLDPVIMTRPMTDGPVDLYFAVFSAEGRQLGCAPMGKEFTATWDHGFRLAYSRPVRVRLAEGGRPAWGCITAVTRGAWRPVCRVDVPVSRALAAGDTVTVQDGTLALDFSGTESDLEPSVREALWPPSGYVLRAVPVELS